jgi:hypothetical protein
MVRAAEKLQKGTLGKFEAPIYLLVAVMVGVIGFIATVNIRHALNAKDAERQAFTQHETMPETSKRLIAAKETIAAEDTKEGKVGETKERPEISAGSDAVNQEAPELPVKQGEPVQFEGEPSYKPQSVQSREIRTPKRRAYQTSYSSIQ